MAIVCRRAATNLLDFENTAWCRRHSRDRLRLPRITAGASGGAQRGPGDRAAAPGTLVETEGLRPWADLKPMLEGFQGSMGW